MPASAASMLLHPANPPLSAVTCFHCHDTCPPDALDRLRIGDKHFCCSGCQMVYEILSAHDLCEFYDLPAEARSAKAGGPEAHSAKAGDTQKFTAKPSTVKNYAYLDDPEVQEKLIEFQSGTTAQVTFYLPQMHCVSCIWLLENLCKLDAGVTHSRVNFLKKTATVQFDPSQTSLRKIATLLATIGYAPDLHLGDVDGPKPPALSRRLAYQLGVAGFAFGNVMLFSFPEYVGMSREIDPWFSAAFGYLSLLLALPVLLFSARDYFVSAWQGLRQRQLNIDVPLCLAFLSLFSRSAWEILTHTGAGYLDSFAGLTFLMLIGKWFQQHVWHQLSFERDYKSYFPIAATVRTGDTETSVPVSRLVPGDIITVRSQEVIPADGILLKGTARVDYSFVTGESEPVLVQSGERIFAGGKPTGERVDIALTRRVAQSHLTQLWNNEAFKTNAKGQVTQLADTAGRFFTWLILAFGGGALAYWWGLHGDVPTAINAFTAVMIVACPCNIVLSIPFTLGNILRILGRHRFYLKNIRVVEAFADITAVVFDKTGTITTADGGGRTADSGQRTVDGWKGKPLGFAEKIAIRSLVQHSAHPLSRRIDASMPDVPTEAVEGFEEVLGLGIQGKVNGRAVKIGSEKFVFTPDQQLPGPEALGIKLPGSSLPGSSIFVSIDGTLIGHFEVKNRYREGLAEVLAFFKRVEGRGWRVEGGGSRVEGGGRKVEGREPSTLYPPPSTSPVFLLSGDQAHEAAALASFFPEADTMRFQQSPQDKLDFVKKLQQRGQRVLMLGDGLNDAGALRQSDLGIVVAENTNNFTPACDAILHADEFGRLPQFVRLARAGVRIVNRSYAIALTYNAIGLSFAVTGALSPLVAAVLMPLSSVSIVLFGVGMGNWAARGLVRQ